MYLYYDTENFFGHTMVFRVVATETGGDGLRIFRRYLAMPQ